MIYRPFIWIFTLIILFDTPSNFDLISKNLTLYGDCNEIRPLASAWKSFVDRRFASPTSFFVCLFICFSVGSGFKLHLFKCLLTIFCQICTNSKSISPIDHILIVFFFLNLFIIKKNNKIWNFELSGITCPYLTIMYS